MKKLLLLVLLTVVLVPLYAQSSKPRTSMSIMKFKTKDKKAANPKRIYTQDGLKMFKEISLNNTSTQLNTIELDLLSKYDDVVVNKLHRQYFLFNEFGHIGLANVYGEELIPPIEGNVRYFHMYILFGESTDDFDTIDDQYAKLLSENQSYDLGYSLGLHKAVARNTVTTNEVEIVIPYGKYDIISIIPMSPQLKPRGFYVGKSDNAGNILWGVCDESGHEIIECIYKSVYFDGKEFCGDNDRDMNYWNDYYAQQIGIKKELQNQRKQQWASVLNSVGNTMMLVANNIDKAEVPNNNSPNIINNTQSKENNKSADGYIARNTAYKAYESYANELSKMASGIIEYNDNLRHEYQSKMRNIRQEWESKGYLFTKLDWETWTGK